MTAARERLPVIKMRCQTFCAPLGALPAVTPFRGFVSHQFTDGFDPFPRRHPSYSQCLLRIRLCVREAPCLPNVNPNII